MIPAQFLTPDAPRWPRVPPADDACLAAICRSATALLGAAAAEISVSRSDGLQLGGRADAGGAIAGEQGLRRIAEVPVSSEDGRHAGTLSLFDRSPRRLSRGQIEQLRSLAAIAGAHLPASDRETEPPRAEASRYRALAHALPQMIWVMRATDGEAIYVNRRFEDFYGPIGRSAAARLGRHHPDDQGSLDQAWTLAKQGSAIEMEVRLRRHDDLYRWHKLVMIPVRAGDTVVEWIGTALDIDEIVRAHKQIEDATGLLRLAQTAAGAGVWEWMIDSDAVRLSPESARMHGLVTGGEAEGPVDVDLPRWRATIHPQDFPGLRSAAGSAVREGGSFTTEFRVAVPSGGEGQEFRWLQTFGQLQSDAKTGLPDRLVGLSLDVTERKEAQTRIEHMAHHDGLTGLPNRALLRERLSAALASKARFALLLCDLDGFKGVNDTLGHAAGDCLLQAIAGRLLAASRSVDTVARLGGDEFAVLLGRADAEAADTAARRLIEAVARPVDLDGHEARVGMSIGIATVGTTPPGIDDLMRAADAALYGAKASGRNTHRFAASDDMPGIR